MNYESTIVSVSAQKITSPELVFGRVQYEGSVFRFRSQLEETLIEFYILAPEFGFHPQRPNLSKAFNSLSRVELSRGAGTIIERLLRLRKAQ